MFLLPVRILALSTMLVWMQVHGANLDAYFGTYVGVAYVETDATRSAEQRDIDIVISPYKKTGFKIEWITVAKVDGRRDVPGVKRWVNRVLFVPDKNTKRYVQVSEYDPFRERTPPKTMLGESVRWAVLDEHGLQIYSFAVIEDGRYELQSYNRKLTKSGLNLLFKRMEDGEVKLRITGLAVRTANPE